MHYNIINFNFLPVAMVALDELDCRDSHDTVAVVLRMILSVEDSIVRQYIMIILSVQ